MSRHWAHIRIIKALVISGSWWVAEVRWKQCSVPARETREIQQSAKGRLRSHRRTVRYSYVAEMMLDTRSSYSITRAQAAGKQIDRTNTRLSNLKAAAEAATERVEPKQHKHSAKVHSVRSIIIKLNIGKWSICTQATNKSWAAVVESILTERESRRSESM